MPYPSFHPAAGYISAPVTTLRQTGKKVFLIRRHFKQMCQTIALKSKYLFIAFYGFAFKCNALFGSTLHKLRVAPQGLKVCHTAWLPPHSSRQLLCPSQHFIHSLLSSAPLHHVRRLMQFAHVMVLLRKYAMINTRQHSYTFAKLCYNTHWVSFRFFVATSFQYCSVHPLPIILLAGRPTTAAFSKCCNYVLHPGLSHALRCLRLAALTSLA